jgi:fatty-acyl-CoA synthase
MSFIRDLAAHGAQQFPHRTALIWQDQPWTYAELDRRAARLAATLRREGLRAGDRVALLADNHLAHVDLLLAAAKCGVIAVPLNPRLGTREADQLLDRAAPGCLLFGAAAASLAAAYPGPRCALERYDAWLSPEPLPAAEATVAPEDLWMLLGTGGSTGTPKLAALSYRQINANGAATVSAWGLQPDDVTLQVAPAFHAAVNVLATPLWRIGGAVVWRAGFDPAAWLADAARYGVSTAFLVPGLYRQLLGLPEFSRARLPRLRWAISGGAPCPPAVAAAVAARGLPFRQGYGLTEAGVNVFVISLEEAARKPTAVGRPLPGITARLRRADGGDAAPGEPGELMLRGPQLFSGYYRAPEATAAALQDGWLATGDLAVVDDEGAYRICGRCKEVYISGGENVFPAEVEAELLALPGIQEAAVLGVPDPRWGESGLAVVVAADDAGWTPQRLAAALRARLAPHQRPRQIRLVAALPKTATGKILKTALRAALSAEAP